MINFLYSINDLYKGKRSLLIITLYTLSFFLILFSHLENLTCIIKYNDDNNNNDNNDNNNNNNMLYLKCKNMKLKKNYINCKIMKILQITKLECQC